MKNIFRYTIGEEIASSVIHGIGFLAAIAGLVFLCIHSGRSYDGGAITSCVIYGVTLMLMYLFSTLYHSIPHEKTKKVFRILDHEAIFLLIAGTYTPFLLITLRGALGWS